MTTSSTARFPARSSPAQVLWSLAVEEHFYLAYPFAFLLMTTRWRAGALIFMGLLAPLVLRLLKYHLLGVSPHAIYIATDTRIDSILFGCALALLERSAATARIFPQAPFLRWTILCSALAILCFTFLYRDPAFRATFRYTLQGLALMPLFHYAVRMPRMFPFSILNTPAMRWIGVRSYTMYLIHFVAIQMLIDYGVAKNDTFTLLVVGSMVTTVYAAVMYRYVESPLARLRKSLHKRRAPPAPSTTSHYRKEQCFGA
ncbi:acyltransferase family protein [Amphiplicatus metriothermophilus]|uniref:acyltransferase family protein n=1 Tax=Amphiplicatus metriothermophilus TaxID=1519374 RepID=UPI002286793D|nr:acyltransferase [Amphiplicatus metriothermophilus]